MRRSWMYRRFLRQFVRALHFGHAFADYSFLFGNLTVILVMVSCLTSFCAEYYLAGTN
jgi:hypothetical protein